MLDRDLDAFHARSGGPTLPPTRRSMGWRGSRSGDSRAEPRLKPRQDAGQEWICPGERKRYVGSCPE